MGIDIYLKWYRQKQTEREQQINAGFSTTCGNVGYLREAYHGGPYATKILVREAFESPKCKAVIPAAVMRERLSNVTEPARGVDGGHIIAELFSKMFSENEDGATVSPAVKSGETQPMTVEEAVRTRYALVYPDADKNTVEAAVQSFKDFVELAEQKEKETGRPCVVYASY